ncbi:MAG: polyprenyl diphosphate synthase [Gammaproteobacteria bacterium]
MMEGPVPAHVAIIMDGNGRWARKRSLPRHAGHQAGVKSTRSVIEASAKAGVGALTLFAFSSENWRRPAGEVSRLMELFLSTLGSEVQKLHENGIRVRFIGDRAAFGNGLQREMDRAEALTAPNTSMHLNVAVNYGGRWELVNATRRLADKVASGELKAAEIDENALRAELALPADMAEPDLFIRTGGDQRLSNFLLWHLAYTELYFTDTLWPDFGADDFHAALEAFAERERRFGGVPDAGTGA